MVLIGEAYKAQKMTIGAPIGNKNAEKQCDQIGHFVSNKTRKEIAKQFSVGEGTVQRAEQFVDGLNAAEEISPGIKEAVLSGAVKAPKQMIAKPTQKPTQETNDKRQQRATGKTGNRLGRNG